MTRLEKYLVSEAKAVTQSQTTMSRYIAIGNLIIRLSDHYAPNQDEADIQIIYSVNKSDIYSVFIKENTKILHYNGKQIKEFIKSYSLIKEMCSITRPPKEEKKEEATNDIYTVEVEPSRLADHNLTKNQLIIKNKIASLWKPSELGYLKEMILKETGKVNAWSANFQKFLATNEVSYLEAITLYKTFVRQNMQFKISNLEYMLKRLSTRN